MTESVLISIRPKWCDLIASGRKTIELRKSRPKINKPFKCYIYCTLEGNREYFHSIAVNDGMYEAQKKWYREAWYERKGNVIGEFVCDNINFISADSFVVKEEADIACLGTCLTHEQVKEYAGWKPGTPIWKCKHIYGWHISELKIYDTPKPLSDFWVEDNRTNDCPQLTPLKRPPQSWCYVEERRKDDCN